MNTHPEVRRCSSCSKDVEVVLFESPHSACPTCVYLDIPNLDFRLVKYQSDGFTLNLTFEKKTFRTKISLAHQFMIDMGMHPARESLRETLERRYTAYLRKEQLSR